MEFLIGFIIVTYGISTSGIVARVTPNSMLGRVTSAQRFVIYGSVPLGALAGGALATWIGNGNALFFAVACIFLGVVSLFLSPLRSQRTLPSEWEVL
ncbi:hypothetical protein [Brevibacterium linens]|uniref:hypothetical protein n=1 Tax=Brevibacterium linens TaxID=1703 RepID=UPI0011AFC81D|nr:hypothetical protein [Brevibacterium linens]